MLYPIIIIGSLITYYYFPSIKSSLSDKIFGYINIKCANNSCNKSYKILKNDIIDITKKYYCNSVCEYIAHNNEVENFVKMHKFVC